MKIFIASPHINTCLKYHFVKPATKMNLLVSYGSEALESFLDTQHCDAKNLFNCIFLDSGTWALNNSGPESSKLRLLNIDAYILLLERFSHLFDHYANFDEDFSAGDITTNLINLKHLETAGFSPLPVVHDIEGDEIDIFIDRGYNYIGLGSSQVGTRKSLEKALRRFDGTDIKVHLFGCTKFKFIADYPIYSCDSSGWAGAASFGFVNYWNEEKPGPDKKDKIYLCNRLGVTGKNDIWSHPQREKFWKFLREELTIDFLKLLSDQQLQYIANIHFVTQMEKAVNEVQRKHGYFTAE